MFSTIQPGERPNDSSTALEGKRLLGRTKTGSKRFAFSDSFPPEKTITSVIGLEAGKGFGVVRGVAWQKSTLPRPGISTWHVGRPAF
jgi:hypothetical protein